MDYQNHNTESRKNKHLNMKERMIVEIRLKDGFSAYKIAKELNRPINTVLNEIRRGTTKQIKQGKEFNVYFADTGEAVYKKNRLKSSRKYKLLECSDFIKYVVDKVKNDHWSLDACVGEALHSSRFSPSQIISTKTLYNYVDLGLLPIKNIDLPAKLHRNKKSTRVRNNKKKLGTSISDRPNSIENREEFGHWEIDCVLGEKSNKDNVLLTLVERKTRYAIISEMPSHSAISVTKTLDKIKEFTKVQFLHWTQEEFPCCFRKMLTLEQYRDPELAKLYQKYLSGGPLLYIEEVFRGFTDNEGKAKQLALDFYGPIFLLYSIYDGAEDKEAIVTLVELHVERFSKMLLTKKKEGAES